MDTVKSILKGDKYIWGVYLMLCMISIVEMYSATSTLTFKIQDYLAPTIRHTLILFCGTIGVIIIHNFHYKWFKLIPVVLLPLSFILLVYAMFFGEEVNGAQRWLTICGIPLQPSELAKMAVVITVSFILAKKQVPGGVQPDTFKTILIIVSIFCMLILPENFSTSALLGLVCFCLMLIGRVELIKLFKLVAVLAGFVIVLFSISPYIPENTPVLDRIPTWRARILNFSHGNDVPEYAVKTNDKNYQVHHARMAIANGGAIGTFPGNSRERDFLPQAYSDFIYAIIIEEMGVVGGVVVMALYLSLLIRAGMIAKKCTRAFPAFLIMGIAMMIVFQAIVNMSVASGLIPVTGQPLPLISRGGTSTIITCAYFGIMLSISRYATQDAIKEEKELTGEETEILEDISAPNPNML